MRQFRRLALSALLLVTGLFVPSGAASILAAPAEYVSPMPRKVYIGHASRLTLNIPPHWSPNKLGIYQGPDGAVWDFPVAGAGLTLATACHQESKDGFYGTAPEVERAQVAGQEACIIYPSDDQPEWALGTMAAVLRHPYPFESYGETAEYVAIGVDPDHFESIANSLSFDPDAVTAKDYFTSVFELIRAVSIKRDDLEWDQVRTKAMATLGTSGTLADAYPGIQYMLDRLANVGDYNSYFMTPEAGKLAVENEWSGFGLMLDGDQIVIVFPGSPADRAGLRVGDVIETVDGKIAWVAQDVLYNPDPKEARFRIRRPGVSDPIEVAMTPEVFDAYLPPEGRRLEDVGYVELFGVSGDSATMSRYATATQDIISHIDQLPTCGWVIDLRRNLGGSYFPMVAGVGSILGNGNIWGYQTPDGETTIVTYKDGHITDAGIDYFGQLVEGSLYPLKKPMPPVAVLMGPLTIGSGEVTLLSFAGRADTRFFGENSGGYTLASMSFELFDGAMLELAGSMMTDRTGKTYPSGVVPDAWVPTDWTSHGSDDDPVVQAAIEWLEEQPACAGIKFDPD